MSVPFSRWAWPSPLAALCLACACDKAPDPPPPEREPVGTPAMQGRPAPPPATASAPLVTAKATPGKKPNIVFIMGDDVGWSNVGVYNQGIMAGRTPNLDQLAAEGMRFTDYYAEPSCTAGRANFITGQCGRDSPPSVRPVPPWACRTPRRPTATILRSMGYATGQFGTNHLGDRNEFLPTVHGEEVVRPRGQRAGVPRAVARFDEAVGERGDRSGDEPVSDVDGGGAGPQAPLR